MSCSSAPVTATSRSIPGNVALVALTAWATLEAMLEQSVAVGLVVVLGGGRDAVGGPQLGVLADHPLQQLAQVRPADRREQLAQLRLQLLDGARRAVAQVLGRVAPGRGRLQIRAG